ncbi:MAG TPA: cupin domain-containing protein, partial [Terriglobales bacterium]|nr:cupin domain-containing protein [Terriglobales bacterium]
MDALSEILHSVKLEGAAFLNAEFTAPWGVRSASAGEFAAFFRKETNHFIVFHLLTEGRAKAQVEGSNHTI